MSLEPHAHLPPHQGHRVEEVVGEVVREQPLSVFVNGEKFLTLLCSPMMLEALVVGYLWMEKVSPTSPRSRICRCRRSTGGPR